MTVFAVVFAQVSGQMTSDPLRHPLVVTGFGVLLTTILGAVVGMLRELRKLRTDLSAHMAAEAVEQQVRQTIEQHLDRQITETNRDVKALHQRLDRELQARRQLSWWERTFGGSRAA